MFRLSRVLCLAPLALLMACTPPSSDLGRSPDVAAARFKAISLTQGNQQLIFASQLDDIRAHLDDVLAGKYSTVKNVNDATTADHWYMIRLPAGSLPAADKKVQYDLANASGINIQLRGPNPVFEQGSDKGTFLGTFTCDSATAQVTGQLEIAGQNVVTSVKQMSYTQGAPVGFALYLDYSGTYPTSTGDKHTHAVFRFGSLVQLVTE